MAKHRANIVADVVAAAMPRGTALSAIGFTRVYSPAIQKIAWSMGLEEAEVAAEAWILVATRGPIGDASKEAHAILKRLRWRARELRFGACKHRLVISASEACLCVSDLARREDRASTWAPLQPAGSDAGEDGFGITVESRPSGTSAIPCLHPPTLARRLGLGARQARRLVAAWRRFNALQDDDSEGGSLA